MIKDAFMRVPYGATVHGSEEIAAVNHVLNTSTQMGNHVYEMEAKIANLFKKKYGLMVNSGSSANYLAVEILQLPEGSEVITPVLTFSTTVAPLVRNKLIPVFVDVSEGTYQIDANKIEGMLTDKTRLIMVPNLLGNLPDWEKIQQIATEHNLIIIEDSCDTVGATIGNYSSGFYSDISTTSFYGSHIINCAGNGGMLCLNDQELYEKSKLLRSWGRSSSLFTESEAIENRFNVDLEGIQYDAKFIFELLGYNLEPSEMGAAFGLAQLNKLPNNMAQRNKWFNAHFDFFKRYEDWFILPKQLPNSYTAWLAFPLTVKPSAPFTRTEMQIFLEKRNIQTRTIFTGNILKQPGFKNIPHRAATEGYPYADEVMQGGILLGCHHGFSEEMLQHVCESFVLFTSQF